MRRVLHSFLLLAVLVYSSPLCSCLMQRFVAPTAGCHTVHEIASGRSDCGTPTTFVVDHAIVDTTTYNATTPIDDSRACVCEAPKSSADRAFAHIPLDLPTPLASLAMFSEPVAAISIVAPTTAYAPSEPPAERPLPLLI